MYILSISTPNILNLVSYKVHEKFHAKNAPRCHMDSLSLVICKFGVLSIWCDGLCPCNFPTWACHYNVQPLKLEKGEQFSFSPNRYFCSLSIVTLVDKLFSKGKSVCQTISRQEQQCPCLRWKCSENHKSR